MGQNRELIGGIILDRDCAQSRTFMCDGVQLLSSIQVCIIHVDTNANRVVAYTVCLT